MVGSIQVLGNVYYSSYINQIVIIKWYINLKIVFSIFMFSATKNKRLKSTKKIKIYRDYLLHSKTNFDFIT